MLNFRIHFGTNNSNKRKIGNLEEKNGKFQAKFWIPEN